MLLDIDKEICMKALLLIVLIMIMGCGYSELGTQVVGQVKGIQKHNPILCDNYKVLDLSLGVMIDGVGSMSTEDKYYNIMTEEQEQTLEKATGHIVKITVDEKRFNWCINTSHISKIEIVK
jgi:hypothetical protein